MVIFHSYVKLPEGTCSQVWPLFYRSLPTPFAMGDMGDGIGSIHGILVLSSFPQIKSNKCRTDYRWVSSIIWYIYIYIHIHTHIHTYTHTYITLHYITLHYTTLHYITLHFTYIHTHTHTYIHTYLHTYIHTYTHRHTYIHTYTLHTYIHTHTDIHTYIHTHTDIHTYIHYITLHYITIHTYIHYIHTYIYIYIYISYVTISMGVEMARDGTPFFPTAFLSFALTSGVGNAGLLSLGSGQMVTSRSIYVWWGFHKWGYPNSWMVYFMEHRIKMDNLGVPPF